MSATDPAKPSGAMRTANLTLLFVTMDDFAERMAKLSYEDQAALAAVFEALSTQVARRYGGTKVKTVQESQLFTFPSPTSAMKAAAAMQDRAARYSRSSPEELRVTLRIGAASGEVRLFGNDVFGEPVNLAARVKGLAESGEVLLTGAVHLSMNRAEVSTELVGKRRFKGVPGQTEVRRLAKEDEKDDAYGGKALDALRLPDLDVTDARALASGGLAWRLSRLKRALLERGSAKGEDGGRIEQRRDPDSRGAPEASLAHGDAPLPSQKVKRNLRAAATTCGRLLRKNTRVASLTLGTLLVAFIVILGARALTIIAGSTEPLDPQTAREALPELKREAERSPEDPALAAALAHALARSGREEAAVAAYLRLASDDPDALQRVHIDDLVELLPIPGEATGDVEAALKSVGEAAVEPLFAVWRDDDAPRYHRRRAGQVLVALGHDVDLVPIWMATLQSSQCAAQVFAARELARLGDSRAIPALERAAGEGCLRGRSAARRALSVLQE